MNLGFPVQKISKMNVNTHARRILVKGNGPFMTVISVILLAEHVLVHFILGRNFNSTFSWMWFCMKARRCRSIYLGVVVLLVWYIEYALLQLNSCHDISPEKINSLVYFFAHPYSLYSISQSTTKIVSFHNSVLKYTHLQCRDAWSQIATQDISAYSTESKVYLSSTYSRDVKIDKGTLMCSIEIVN